MITLAQAVTNGTGIERKFNCPVHPDATASASVNVAKGIWYCYGCHASGTVDGKIFDEIDAETVYQSVKEILHENEVEYRPEGWLDQFDAGQARSEYWLSRASSRARSSILPAGFMTPSRTRPPIRCVRLAGVFWAWCDEI